MRTVGRISVLAILPFTLASMAQAQTPVPPPTGISPALPAAGSPAPGTVAPGTGPAASPQPGGAAQPGAPGAATARPPTPAPAAPPAATVPPATAAPASNPTATTDASMTATGAAAAGAQPGATGEATLAGESGNPATLASGEAAAATEPADTQAFDREQREASLRLGNSLSGSVGLLHMQTPFSGAPGTFRISFTTGYFTGSGFLCKSRSICGVPDSMAPGSTQDKASSSTADIGLSATLLPYLEGYLGMHSAANSNNFGKPALLQVVGDTNLGLKLFLPTKADRIFAVGTSMDLWMLMGSGSLGISNANFTMRGMASIDLARRSDPDKRVPLRFHSSVGYLFDGSGSLITEVEKQRGGNRISRIERFGLAINRVDSFLVGLGAEYAAKVLQPFVEWNIDVPMNFRQNYKCSAEDVGSGRSPGDGCLAKQSGFSSTPSRLTLGARITPPWVRGLGGLVAFDVGTGGTSTFIEEIAPERPWRIYFGLNFAHDITSTGVEAPPKIVEKVVQLPPPPEYRVVGLVLDEKTQQPVPNAIVKFQGQPGLTGMVSRQDGSFETANLQPGSYTFTITADGYREGSCVANVAPVAPAAPPPAAAAPGGADQFGLAAAPAANPDPASAAAPSGPVATNVPCPLKPVPPVGAIQGALVDGDSNQPVPGARLTIRDAKGRELGLDADGSGAFRFENVPAGSVKISVDADGYLPAVLEIDVKPRAEQRPTLTLHKRPKKASVVVTPTEVKITKQVHFANDSAIIATDSMALVQEIAMVIKEHPALARIEIQGHTDNSGAPAYNKRLSQERAEAVRNALIALGVESARLTAVGYGQDKALVPNSSEANKAKNRRVQMIILEKK